MDKSMTYRGGERVQVLAPSGVIAFNGTYVGHSDTSGFHKVLEDGKTADNFGIHVIYGKTESGDDRIIPIHSL